MSTSEIVARLESLPGRTCTAIRRSRTDGKELVASTTDESEHHITDRNNSEKIISYTRKSLDTVSEEELLTCDESALNLEALRVKSINLMEKQNGIISHTTEYYANRKTDKSDAETNPLFARRGEDFTLEVIFDRPVSPETDELRVVLDIGLFPNISKSTLVKLHVRNNLETQKWSLTVDDLPGDGSAVLFTIRTPPDCVIGKWNINIDSCLIEEERKTYFRYKIPESLYLLFNPWFKDDLVYAEDENIDEHLMKRTARIYSGNQVQIGYKTWSFDQFDSSAIDTALILIEEQQLNYSIRNKPLKVARAICKSIAPITGGGVMEVDWSSSSHSNTNSTPPTAWIGSADILKKFLETRRPVRYGQCWTLAAVFSTLCRSIGIPSRVITGFNIAHDCDGFNTIDYHWSNQGELLHHQTEEDPWIFHCWSEVWMDRDDLPTGYGGWQAVDPTPQKTSDGVQVAGPCSVKAIKYGLVNQPYDCSLFFASLNADRNDWIEDENGQWEKRISRHRTGVRLSTFCSSGTKVEKQVNDLWQYYFKDDDKREDITSHYKHKRDTEEERSALYRAGLPACTAGEYTSAEPDVKFTVIQRDEVLVGNNIDVTVKLQNQCRYERNVHMSVTLNTVFYTGVNKSKVKTQHFNINLGPIKADNAVMRLSMEDYTHLVLEQIAFKVTIYARVMETGQIFANQDNLRLRRPTLDIQVPRLIKVNEPFDVRVNFANSMPNHLTQCQWKVQGPGFYNCKTIKQENLEPYDRKSNVVPMKIDAPGSYSIIASFYSQELSDVTGHADVFIKE